MDIKLVGNPFINTPLEYRGWELINTIHSSDEDGDIMILGKVINLGDICGAYRKVKITEDISIGDIVYCKTKTPFVGYVEFESDGLIHVINARTKVSMFLTLPMIQKVDYISNLNDLKKYHKIVGDISITKNSIFVNFNDGKAKGIRLDTPGGYYESFHSLQENFNLNVIYKPSVISTLNNQSLNFLCNTLQYKVLLNNTDDTSRWQLIDKNNKIFDFNIYLLSLGYIYK